MPRFFITFIFRSKSLKIFDDFDNKYMRHDIGKAIDEA